MGKRCLNLFAKIYFLTPILLLGCTSVGTTQVKHGNPKPADCPLDIFTSESEVQRPYEVLCLIDSRTGTTAFHEKTAAAAIKAAKPAACQCGADAIVIMSADTEGVTMTTWGKGKAIIKAIRYID